MRFWRACVADPWSGGLVAVTVALFVALQGFVGSYGIASGSSHQRVVDGFVVCTLTGAKLAPVGPDGQLPGNDSHLCCCSLGILSPHGKLLLAAFLAGAALFIVRRTGSAYSWSVRLQDYLPAVCRTAAAGPRAPPILSV
jgi:hypothetical protein